MRRIISTAMLTLTMAAAGAGVARAQQTPAQPISPGHMTVTPFVGFGFGGDLEGASALVGVAGAYNWDSRVSFEGEFSWLPSVGDDTINEIESTVWNLTANILYHFAERPFMPYVAGGFGIGHASVDVDLLNEDLEDLLGDEFEDSSTELVFNFGGGVKRQFGERASFRGDLRYFTGDDFLPDFLRLYVGIGFDLGRR